MNYLRHLESNSISIPSQTIDPEMRGLFRDQKKNTFAKFFVEQINQQLVKSESYSVMAGRTVSIKINNCNLAFDKAKEIWDDIPYLLKPNTLSFKSVLNEILEQLRENGCIFSYKFNYSYTSVRVVC